MTSPDGALLRISVAYALPEEQHIVSLLLPVGSRVEEAVARSGLLQRFTEIAARPLQCAIFSRMVAGSEVLQEGDRIEILRPLQLDPKEQRRREAARARARRGA